MADALTSSRQSRAPGMPLTYAATVAVLEAVRKAKAEANLSMKAPVKQVTVTGKADALEAVQATAADICQMLQIEELIVVEGTVEPGIVQVVTRIA